MRTEVTITGGWSGSVTVVVLLRGIQTGMSFEDNSKKEHQVRGRSSKTRREKPGPP